MSVYGLSPRQREDSRPATGNINGLMMIVLPAAWAEHWAPPAPPGALARDHATTAVRLPGAAKNH